MGWGGTPGGSRGTAVQLQYRRSVLQPVAVRGDGALEAGTAGEQVEGVPPSLLSGSWWASPILQGQVHAFSKQWSPAPSVVNDRSSLLPSPGVHRSSPSWLPAGRHFLDKCPRLLRAMHPLHNPLKGHYPACRGDSCRGHSQGLPWVPIAVRGEPEPRLAGPSGSVQGGRTPWPPGLWRVSRSLLNGDGEEGPV